MPHYKETCLSLYPPYLDTSVQQIDAPRSELKVFFGEDLMNSKDISRIVNLYHFTRLSKLMDEEKVSDKIVLGGQRDEKQL